MHRDVSAIAVTAGASGKGGSWGVRLAAGIAFCRDRAAILPPRRKRRGRLVVITYQEKAPACRPATTKP